LRQTKRFCKRRRTQGACPQKHKAFVNRGAQHRGEIPEQKTCFGPKVQEKNEMGEGVNYSQKRGHRFAIFGEGDSRCGRCKKNLKNNKKKKQRIDQNQRGWQTDNSQGGKRKRGAQKGDEAGVGWRRRNGGLAKKGEKNEKQAPCRKKFVNSEREEIKCCGASKKEEKTKKRETKNPKKTN